jgi:hypothetical protein
MPLLHGMSSTGLSSGMQAYKYKGKQAQQFATYAPPTWYDLYRIIIRHAGI